MFSRRRLLAALPAALPGATPLACLAQPAPASAFPARAVRIVVPYSVGVGPDVVARALAEQLSQAWQQPVLIDNKPGASGIVAYGEVRRTAADGHTLFLAGHAVHVAVETLADAASLQLLHVPFKDVGSLITAVVAGDIDFTAFSMNTFAGLYERGQLRPLAVAAQQRLPGHPDIATLAEAGGPAIEMHPWAALVAVAGTPQPVLARLHQDIVAALADPGLRRRAGQAGFDITPSTAQALRERIDADIAACRPLLDNGRLARL